MISLKTKKQHRLRTHAAYELLKEQLEDVLDTLTDREENVLRLRFGLDDGRTRTLEEVGKVFGRNERTYPSN